MSISGRTPGRPKSETSAEQVEQLARAFCRIPEIASVLGVSESLIHKRFSKAVAKGFNAGRALLRRRQWEAANNGNVTMLIWLGKQYLDQADKAEVKTAYGDLYQDDPVKIANDLRRRGKALAAAVRNDPANGNGKHNGNGHSNGNGNGSNGNGRHS